MVSATDNLSIIQEFAAYPNPANQVLQVQWQLPLDGPAEIVMADLLGKVVYRAQRTAAEGLQVQEIPLGSISSGVYLLQLKSGQSTVQLKVVVQK